MEPKSNSQTEPKQASPASVTQNCEFKAPPPRQHTVSATAHLGNPFPAYAPTDVLRFQHISDVKGILGGTTPPIAGAAFLAEASPQSTFPMAPAQGFMAAFAQNASDPAARKRAIRMAQQNNPNSMNLFAPIKPTTGIHASQSTTSVFDSQSPSRNSVSRHTPTNSTTTPNKKPLRASPVFPPDSSLPTRAPQPSSNEAKFTSSSEDKNDLSSSSAEPKADRQLPARAFKKRQMDAEASGSALNQAREGSGNSPLSRNSSAFEFHQIETPSSTSSKNHHHHHPKTEIDGKASRVLDFMLLGGIDDAFDMEFLSKHNITTILNVSSEEYGTDGFPPGMKVKHVLMQDAWNFAIDQTFDQCFEVIDDVRKRYFEQVKQLDEIAGKIGERGVVVGGYPRFQKQDDRKSAADRGSTPVAYRTDTPMTGVVATGPYPSTPVVDHNHSPNAHEPSSIFDLYASPAISQAASVSQPIILVPQEHFPERILIHCQKGRSRSATIVAAYLIRSNGWNVVETLGYLTRCRRVVDPNIGFIDRLKNLQQSIEKHSRTEDHKKLVCCARAIHPTWLEGANATGRLRNNEIRTFFTSVVGMVFEVNVNTAMNLSSIKFVCHESVERAVRMFKQHREDFAKLESPHHNGNGVGNASTSVHTKPVSSKPTRAVKHPTKPSVRKLPTPPTFSEAMEAEKFQGLSTKKRVDSPDAGKPARESESAPVGAPRSGPKQENKLKIFAPNF